MPRRKTLVAAMFLVVGHLRAQTGSTQGRLQDLNFVSTQLPRLDPYFFGTLSNAGFSAAVSSLESRIATLTDAQFMVSLAQLVTMAGDPHTSLFLSGSAAQNVGFQTFPLTFRWLDDGVFVTGASAPYAQAIGSRLVQVGNTPIDQVVQMLGTVIPSENTQWLHYRAQDYLRGQKILQGLGVLPDGPASSLTFQDLAGNEFTLPVTPSNDPLLMAPDPSQGPTNLYLSTTGPNYSFVYEAPPRLLYVRYLVCQNDPNNPFSAFAAAVLQTLDSNPVDSLVLDFRDNGGGDSSVINPLLNGLGLRLSSLLANPAFRVFDVINKGTFSSGVDDAAEIESQTLQAASQIPGIAARLTVIGESTGGATAGYGNVTAFTLPASMLTGQYSTTFVSAPPGILAGPSFGPDVPVSTRSTDYFARFDPVTAAIVARSGGPAPPPSGNVIAVNGASFRTEPGLAPGSFASAFGNFSKVPDEVLVAGAAGTVVNGSVSQVNFIMPTSLPLGPAKISVVANGVELATGQASVTQASPGLFILQPADPAQPGAVENQDFSVNSKTNPASEGSILQIFATGYGPLDSTGAAPVQVFIAGTPSQVLYSGPVAQFPGLWQINAQVPAMLAGQVSLYLVAEGVASNAVTVWVH